MSSGVLVFIYIVALILVLCLNGLLASNASDIAHDKGYEKRKWFHLCFWLGLVPYIIIAAMPDRKIHEKQDKTNELLEKLIGASHPTGENKPQKQSDDLRSWLPEI